MFISSFAAIDNESPAILVEFDAVFGLPPILVQLCPVAPLVQLGLVALISPLGSLHVFHESLQGLLVVEEAQKLVLRPIVVAVVVVAYVVVVVVVVVPTVVIGGASRGAWM